MTANIIDGKKIAQGIRDKLKAAAAELTVKPGLAVVLVGADPASRTYVHSKEKACQEIGFYSEVHRLPETVSEAELLALVSKLNKDSRIHGVLVQLPLPAHIRTDKIILAIDPAKDVDCFHPLNTGALFSGLTSGILPCTPAGCLELIKSTGLALSGKKAAVVGRSNIVGKPAALLLLHHDCTVTLCHSRTADLAAELQQADIVIAAAGRAGLITGAMLKPGAVVIDVGTNRVNGRLTGDVDFASAVQTAGFITPVPGGVGPLTIAMLMQNTLNVCRQKL
ncbi:MAG: bifunctional 5,10-methylenetetrahydrofolate dehydrogenase/5,10-methenyltetrahydrofolate cyclohydrolase [Candidatus Margulisbacteria bacterium]|jgi:methylenetetrahydrofolate dehydrogenase (NADP+)/methenyltetrahydrofolate cyclohydrolase|nr:bifunctional 5,10-methylenetetrahydrofolate dehydrogenase/5,10-methenyltetrahydrofolate cyclohydrolase [Candidatus Margulisiibacteriota bacterium]